MLLPVNSGMKRSIFLEHAALFSSSSVSSISLSSSSPSTRILLQASDHMKDIPVAGMNMMQLGLRSRYRSLIPSFLTMQYMACKTFMYTYLSPTAPNCIICLIVYNYVLRGCICSVCVRARAHPHTHTHPHTLVTPEYAWCRELS
jgi:hypothetical protein